MPVIPLSGTVRPSVSFITSKPSPFPLQPQLRFGSDSVTPTPQPRRVSRTLVAVIAGLLGLQATQFGFQQSVNRDNTVAINGLKGQVSTLTGENEALRATLQQEQGKTAALSQKLPTAGLEFLEQMAQERGKASLTFRIYNLEKKEAVSTASGGVIQVGNRSFIITNAHVLEGLDDLNKEAAHGVFFAPYTPGEKTVMYKATPVQIPGQPGEKSVDAVSPARDTALFEIDPEQVAEFNAKIKPAPLYPLDKPLPYGGLVYLYGAPFKQYHSVTLGVLANPAVRQDNDYGLPAIYTDAKSNLGSSGGLAVSARTGEVLGIQMMINNNDTGMTYLVPIRHIKGWLEYECKQPCMTDSEKKMYPPEAYQDDKDSFAAWTKARAIFDAERAKEAKAAKAEEAEQAKGHEEFIRGVQKALKDIESLRRDVDALKGKK
jgi:S1-C subfamily serine protease